MKKYIGLIFSAVLLVMLAVGCSGSFGFDDKDSDDSEIGVVEGEGSENPFIGTKWGYAGNTPILYYSSLKLSFDKKEMTVKYYNGHTNVTFSYSWHRDSESKEYVADLTNGPATMKFKIADVNADEGYLDGTKYNRTSY